MNTNKKDYFNLLYNKVASTRTRETRNLILNGLFLTLGITSILLLISVLIENIAQGDINFRTFLVILIITLSIISFLFTTFPSILRALNIKKLPTINEIALKIGEAYPTIKDKLGNALQLASQTTSINNRGISLELINLNIENVYNETIDKNFDIIINKKRTKLFFLFFLFAILINITTILNVDSLYNSFNRIINYNQSFIPPAPFSIKLINKQDTILRGSNVKIIFKAFGEAPDYINLYLKEKTQKIFDELKLKLKDDNTYTYEITSLKNDIYFYGNASWLTTIISTDTCNICITDKPLVRAFTGNIKYPSYTKLGLKSFDEQTADITALNGSTISFNIRTNKILKDAYIIFEKNEQNLISKDSTKIDTIKYPLTINGTKLNGQFRLTQNGYYHFVLIDSLNLTNENPIKYTVISLSDDAPTISMLFPTSNVQLNEDVILPTKLSISDDYGFSKLELKYKLIASKYSSPEKNYSTIKVPIPTTSENNSIEISYIWNLNKLSIMPEDIYEFYFEVSDNDIITGPKTAKTQIIKLRLPSLEEVSKEADEVQEKVITDLDKLTKETEQIRKNIENLEKELRKNIDKKELDWQQKKQIEDIIQKHEQVKEKMSDLAKQINEVSKQLEENRMLSAETMQKYNELQQLMKEVHSPELERLQKMRQDLLNKMSAEDLRKALEKVKFDEEQFKKSIERTMDILKHIQAEQKTDAITKRAEELKKKEDELNNTLNKTNPNDQQKMNELAEQQKNLKEEANSISKDLKELKEIIKDINKDNNMPMEELQEAQDALDKQGIQDDMQKASDKMRSGEKEKASQSQKSASKKLDNFAKKMQSFKQEMQNKNSKEVIRRLQKAIYNMINISKQQENIKNKTKQTDYNSTRIPEYATQQADLFDKLYNVARDLDELGNKSFAVTYEMFNELLSSLNQMRITMDMMTERRMSNAVRAQTKSMESINKALSQLQNTLSQMQDQQGDGSCQNPGSGNSSGSASGMGQRMQQLAAEQQALNQTMQEMMGNQKTGQDQEGILSQEKRANMKKMAAQQKEMQKSMQQLAQEQKEFGSNNKNDKEANKLARELEKITKEMQEVTKDIQNNSVTKETLERQEKILSKLLDATNSVNERDFEQQRKSKTGKDITNESPKDIELNTQEGKTRVMRELLNSLKQGYTKDYEQIIRRYLKKLTNEE